MISKFGIIGVILVLVFIFYLVISIGAGKFSKDESKPETKKSTTRITKQILKLNFLYE